MPRSAAEAIQQLETVKKPEVIRLSKLLKNESSADEATRDLIEIDAEGSVINALTNSSPAIRRNIFSALANERLSEAAAPALIFLLKDNDPETRSAAIQVLGQIQGKDAIRLPALIQMLGEQNEDVRLATLSALEEMMSATLRDEDPAITPSAYKRQATNLVPAMVQSLSDTNADVREKAVEALGNLGMIRNGKDEQAVAALTGALADADLKVRTAAVKALKYFGAAAKEALPALSQFTGETNSALSTAAADSYKTINADVKTKEQEALVAEKYPRLVMKGGVGAIKKMDSTHWVGETNVAPGIKSPPMLIKKATFELLTPSTDPVAAKMLNEKIDPPEHLADVPIVAFKIPQSGKVWIGWQMDFYVETESNIIGGMLTYWGYVNWHTNLAVEPFNEDLDTVIDHFEKRISGSNLPGTGNRQTDIDGVTRGRSPLLERLYEIPGGAKRVMPQFVGLDVATNTLRLDLENPDTGRQASYWIDLKTRKVGDFTVRDN
jgi:HEAT repeat protein